MRCIVFFVVYHYCFLGRRWGEMKMSKRQEIEAARCNDIPPERGICCCCCLRHRWCFGYMTALLALAAGLIQHFLKEVDKDRLKLQSMFCLGYRQNTSCHEDVILTSHKLLKRAFTPTPVSHNDFFVTKLPKRYSHAPPSSVLIWDKNQSSTLENRFDEIWF